MNLSKIIINDIEFDMVTKSKMKSKNFKYNILLLYSDDGTWFAEAKVDKDYLGFGKTPESALNSLFEYKIFKE